jgi:hypothetical protein
LRAISVLAVIAYHAGAPWMTGGCFGVEVFFVVSGYLITSLLLMERQRSGTTNLRQFWLRRARHRRTTIDAPPRPALVHLVAIDRGRPRQRVVR